MLEYKGNQIIKHGKKRPVHLGKKETQTIWYNRKKYTRIKNSPVIVKQNLSPQA